MNSAELLIAERNRQISDEKFLSSEDDRYTSGELIDAALSYLKAAALQARGEDSVQFLADAGMIPWPWENKWWKPADQKRNLVKAGALILAELDRLERLNPSEKFDSKIYETKDLIGSEGEFTHSQGHICKCKITGTDSYGKNWLKIDYETAEGRIVEGAAIPAKSFRKYLRD